MKSQRSEIGLYSAAVDEEFQRRSFTNGDVPVAVYGLGKMGLPLAAVYADVTGSVVGVDVDESVVEAVAAGDCPVDGEPGLDEAVEELVEGGSLAATTRSQAAAEAASVHVVIVPTLLTDGNEPDLSMLRAAVRSIGAGLDAGDLVVVESTVPPGTCRDVVVPELVAESDLDAGKFGVAFCPERTSSGRALKDIRGAYPKVVGGVDAESTRAAELVYGEITDNDVVPVSDATTAECVKVFEGLYRDVNIALANELGRAAGDFAVDVDEAIDVANTQPFCDIHTPGPGVGGHCIPVYPYFVTDRVDEEMALVESARSVNDEMPAFVADRVADALEERGVAPEDASVVVCGATYRAGVAETRNAPAKGVVEALDEAGVDVAVTDPMLEADDVADWPARFRPTGSMPAPGADAAVLVTDHEAFDDWNWAAFGDAVLVDTRRTVDPDSHDLDQYTVARGFETEGTDGADGGTPADD